MSDTKQYNTQYYWWPTNVDVLNTNFDLLKYWTYDLHDQKNIFVSDLKYIKLSQINFDIFDLWNRKFLNTSKYLSDTDSKAIQISWLICDSSKWALLSRIEKLKQAIVRQNEVLYIKDSKTIKYAKAYCDWIEFSENTYDITKMKFTINFIIVDLLKKYLANETIFINLTTNKSFWIFNDWTLCDWKCEIITNNADWVSNLSLDINWSTINISENINTWDVIMFDSEKSAIYKNYIEVSYTWEFTMLCQWNNVISVNSNWAYDYRFNFKYNKTFR